MKCYSCNASAAIAENDKTNKKIQKNNKQNNKQNKAMGGPVQTRRGDYHPQGSGTYRKSAIKGVYTEYIRGTTSNLY